MIGQLDSTDGSVQTYSVTDSSGAAKNSGIVETGDLLVVTAQDGITKKSYRILVPLEILVKADSQLNSVTKSIPSITLSTSSTNGISYLQTSAVPVGEWIEFNIAVPAAGTYNVSFQYKTNTTGRATVQPYVGGVAKGSPVNQNNATANLFIPVDLGQVTFAAAGSYPVRFVATSAGSIVIDYIKFIKASGEIPAITGFAPAEVTAKAGVAPELPAVVTALYSDNSTKEIAVAWNSIDPSQYASEGSFTVEGTVSGTAIKPAVLVTVIRTDAATKSVLSGTESVQAGESFDLTYGLSNVKDSIYAQDVTFTYDPEKVEFVSAVSVKDGLQIVDRKEAPGQVRIIAASLGSSHAVNSGGDLLKLSWKAKSLSQSTTTAIALSGVIISNGEGVETQVEGASHHLSITAKVIVDKTALYNIIASAQSKHETAVEGGSAGQYPTGSKAVLKAAIESAKAVADNTTATQQQVDEAAAALNASLEAFLASVNTGVRGDVNGDGAVTVGDLAIVARYYGKSSADPDWDQVKIADVNGDGKIDITDLAIIARAIFEN
ncbi:cohesin domain-containing protein [Paenibacillus sp. N3.4]|uniref:cohesin domain-containing protein n=1 Tax=Paenibacillus sp. N3.4 TaxID=2603222 RepID=UPI0021C2AFA7|nr:cohesin domain-containing protein [Paenibacillus sp. N3.4]